MATSSPSVLTIAHRGASYHLPEHSTGAYRLALELGANFIEPDLVATSDSVLIAVHTVDLNVTTNVEDVFGHLQEPWFSPSQGRAGYWSFNFTWAQIQQLRIRQRLPNFRSLLYDGVFHIPSLENILDELQQWNEHDLPARLNTTAGKPDFAPKGGKPSALQKYKAGLYAEIKEASWIQQDSGIDLVDLVFDHISKQKHPYWSALLPCFETIRFDEYIAPGLVWQSFDPLDLQRFHQRWHADNLTTRHAEPPYILLVDKDHCFEDEFWFRVGDSWRSFLSGLGCEKTCLTAGKSSHAMIEKAVEFGLVLHPWTERPEAIFRSTGDSLMEELMYLKCNTSGVVKGWFSESVDTAVYAARTPCPSPSAASHKTLTKNGDCKVQGSSVVVAAVLGFGVALLLSCGSRLWLSKSKTGNMSRVPTTEFSGTVELT